MTYLECGVTTPLFKRRDMSRRTKAVTCHRTPNRTTTTVVKYSVLNENRQLCATKRMAYLPTVEALRDELEQKRALLVRERLASYATAVVPASQTH